MADRSEPTILVIDDDDVVRDSLKVLLETRGFNVVDFSSGRSFLAQRDEIGAGCIVLDVHMPEMSGLDVMKTLRQTGDNTPVVLITGRSDSLVQAKAEAYGAVAVLDKPIAHGLLFTAIGHALSRRTA
jgi:FixJ family two-component response regulator